jgi:homospermidine synthase
VLNPSTELYQALTTGQNTDCQFIDHAVEYWDYILMKADARFSDIWGYSFREAVEKVSEPGCPTYKTNCGSFSNLRHKALAMGEKYYVSYLDYDRAREKSLDVQALAQAAAKGFDWKALLPSTYQNLYFVGERAADLLKYFKQ